MYRSFSKTALEEMSRTGAVQVRIKSGWETSHVWNSTPCTLVYKYLQREEEAFTGYITQSPRSIQISNLTPCDRIKKNKTMIDGYMRVALIGLEIWARTMLVKRLVIDSNESSMIDHALDLGFHINSKSLHSFATGGRCAKLLGE